MERNDNILWMAVGMSFGLVVAVLIMVLRKPETHAPVIIQQLTPGYDFSEIHNVESLGSIDNNGEKVKSENNVTKKINKSNKTKLLISKPTIIKGKNRLVKVSGSGEINEISVVVNRPDTRIMFVVDDNIILNDTISGLSDIATYSNWLGVQNIGDDYIIVMSNLEYNNGFEVIVNAKEPTMVKMIGKYTEVVSDGR